MSQNQQGIKDMSQLGAAVEGKLVDIPPDLGGIKGVEDYALAKQAAAKVASAKLAFIAALPVALQKLLGVIRKMKGTPAASEAKATLEAKVLNVSDVELQPYARWYYAAAVVADAVEHTGDPSYIEVRKDLEVRQILRRLEEGKVERIGEFRHRAGTDTFVPALRYAADLRPQVRLTFEGLETLAGISRNIQSDETDARRQEFEKDAVKSAEQCFAGEPGVYILYVPKGESFTPKDRETGKPLLDSKTGEPVVIEKKPGQLKVRSDGKTVILVDTFGPFGFRKWMGEAVAAKAAVTLDATKRDRVKLDLAISRRMTKAQVSGFYRLHEALYRAWRGNQEAMSKKAEADAVAAKATVDDKAWLTGAIGVGFVKHRRFEWTGKDGKVMYYHPFTLVERAESPDGPTVRLLETNAPDLFAGVPKDPMAEGVEYAGVQKPLGQFLRKASRWAHESSETEHNQEAYREWAEAQRGIAPTETAEGDEPSATDEGGEA